MPTVIVMKLSRRSTAIILTLCLLILQAQVWASAMLGCRHEAGHDVQMLASCHAQPADHMTTASPQLDPFDCYKCALNCLVTVAVPMVDGPPMLALQGAPSPVATVGRHFYRFIPALPERPPRV
ncbi:hypothetical protein [Thiorhodococcus minor]|uniref:DUF2946 domain-containing protein n=1 Tax=Thiorhodococcus minor TaxID=57489 RepID=A0A6M0JW43_9GAMM|nr:hypothetical protein [Thiorhodococcus minor]NEV61409.1 hypothetical protein [Thiorhodococcus minor]